jgi:hypothetical protein
VVVVAYVGFGVLVLILAAVVGTWFAAMRGQANPNFASPGFVVVMGLLFGVPCYFVGSYLRENGSESTSLVVLIVSASLGLLIGLRNRA